MNTESKNRIGILGGSFNPVHTGHLILAQTALETFELSKVLFMPCANNPCKSASVLLSETHRMAMIEVAIEGDVRFEISDIEIRRGGISYAIDTVVQIKETYPDTEPYFIIGADTLTELHQWKDIYKLLELCKFCIIGRSGTDINSLFSRDINLNPPWPEHLLKNVVNKFQIDISSSDIRHRIAEGMSIRYLVPDAVEMYIAEHNLYQTGRD